MLLPGTNVQVMDATDAQFQQAIAEKVGIAPDDLGWSFDDRCRLINHLRRMGRDVFANPPKNIPETIPNNSETVQSAELFGVYEAAPEANLQPSCTKGE